MTGKVPKLVPTSGALRIKGVLRRYYDSKHQRMVNRSWPSSNGGNTPARLAAQADFTTCQQVIKNAAPADIEGAQALAARTPFLTRDLLMKAAYGTLLTARTRDGSLYMGYRMAFSEIQTLLESLSSTQGVLIYRGSDGWYALAPADEGKVLTTHGAGQNPSWVAPATPDTGAQQYAPSVNGLTTPDVQAYAARGTVFTPHIAISLEASSCVWSPDAAGSYKMGIAPFDTTTHKITAAPLYSDTLSGLTAAFQSQLFNWPTKLALTSGTSYLIFIVRTDGSGTASVNMAYSSQDQSAPALYINHLGAATKLASNDPQITDTWTVADFTYSSMPIYKLT